MTESSDTQTFDPKIWLDTLAAQSQDAFANNRRVMSFDAYLSYFIANPVHQLRCSARYVLDVFDFFGSETVAGPRGPQKRFRLFDCPWDPDGRDRLRGQEPVQEAVYRLVRNFAQEGRTNRLILLHGPNGSAKSTFIGCVQRAMEHYATLDEGALYRFNWIFPSQALVKGGIGFGGPEAGDAPALESFADLEEESVDAKLTDELRDHPLLLLPAEARHKLIEKALDGKGASSFRPSRQLVSGDLSPRNRAIFDALLTAAHGDLAKVFRHVQVERFYVSQRYRQSLSTVGPQLAVDAAARQLTLGRDLSALPAAVQAVPLHDYKGELVDANRGLIEYQDLLKRPLDTFKYLLGTAEDGQVSLDLGTLEIDTVFFASSNEGYLTAFKELPEFQSFKGRMEFVRSPYLLDYREEAKVYEDYLRDALRGSGARHQAPHLAWVTALWAVLTRMRKPASEVYEKALAQLVSRIGPLDKALLYAGEGLQGFAPDERRELDSARQKLARESDTYPNYEGRTGASPREMKLLLMNASQSHRYHCVSPFALFEEMEALVKNVSVHAFLKQEPVEGGYHEHLKFVFQVRARLMDRIDDEVRTSMGLVEESRYQDQFSRYVNQVSHYIRGEKVPDPVTGREESASEARMREIESLLEVGVDTKRHAFREQIIAKIGAWSVDNPGAKLDVEDIFANEIGRLRDAFFANKRRLVARIARDLLVLLDDGESALAADAKRDARQTLEQLKSRYGYCEHCARDAVSALIKDRYAD